MSEVSGWMSSPVSDILFLKKKGFLTFLFLSVLVQHG